MKDYTNNTEQNIFDAQGYRFNVGIVILNSRGQVFLGKRCGQDSWQFPQGGLNAGESSTQAMWRELFEETGLTAEHVKIVGSTAGWLKYRLPVRYRRRRRQGMIQCIGQKQKWYLLQLVSPDDKVNLYANKSPEFDDWRWADYWDPVNEVVYFKRKVYRHALDQLREFIPELRVDIQTLPTPQHKLLQSKSKVPSFALSKTSHESHDKHTK